MKKYLILLSLSSFLLAACISGQKIGDKLGPTVFPTQPPSSGAPSPISDWNERGYIMTKLTCATYVETTWGSGSTQWGHNSFIPLVVDAQGMLYLGDYSNKRLLRYDDTHLTSPQVVPLPESYFLDPQLGNSYIPWAMTIVQDKIVIPHGLNHLGVFSTDGFELTDLKSPYDFTVSAPGLYPAWVDSHGGLLIKTNGGGIYFDIGWENGDWKEVTNGAFMVTPFSWKDYIGDTGKLIYPTIQLYRVNLSNEFLKEPEVQIDLHLGSTFNGSQPVLQPTPGPGKVIGFIGADQQGWVYFSVTTWQSEHLLIRYSIPDRHGQVSYLPEKDMPQIIHSGVKPDGTIYLIVYDREDITVQPKIIRCHFPEN